MAITPFLADGLGWPCPVRSALKRTPMQDFYHFPMIFYYISSTTYQKIGDLFCPVHISGLSHSVNRFILLHLVKFFGANTHIIHRTKIKMRKIKS